MRGGYFGALDGVRTLLGRAVYGVRDGEGLSMYGGRIVQEALTRAAPTEPTI